MADKCRQIVTVEENKERKGGRTGEVVKAHLEAVLCIELEFGDTTAAD